MVRPSEGVRSPPAEASSHSHQGDQALVDFATTHRGSAEFERYRIAGVIIGSQHERLSFQRQLCLTVSKDRDDS